MLPIAIMRIGSRGTVKLLTDTASSVVTHPATASASCIVDNTGNVTDTGGNSYAWLPSGSASSYEINATLNSGTVSGTFGSWLNLGTTRSWTLSRSTLGTSGGQITLQIRPVGGSVVATATINFSAEVD